MKLFYFKTNDENIKESLIVQTKKDQFVILDCTENQESDQLMVFRDIPCEEEIVDFKQFTANELLFISSNGLLSLIQFDLVKRESSIVDKIQIREDSEVKCLNFGNNSDKVYIGLADNSGNFVLEIILIGEKNLFKLMNFKSPISIEMSNKISIEALEDDLLSLIGVFSDSGFSEIRSYRIEKEKVFECNRVNFKSVVSIVKICDSGIWTLGNGNNFKFYNF